MKNIMFVILISVLFVACEAMKGGGSYGGYGVWITVENANGDNLLDPEFEGNILNDEIHAEYNGKKFPLQTTQTRALPPPVWYGLVLGDLNDVMMFGEFSANDNLRGETFMIHWGDGTSSEVKFDLFVRGGKVKRTLWIDGELVSDDSLVGTIVK